MTLYISDFIAQCEVLAAFRAELVRKTGHHAASVASKSARASTITVRVRFAHATRCPKGSSSERPTGVSQYSTEGGTVGCTVRPTSPSRCRPRNVWVSIFCEISGMRRRNSLNRTSPADKFRHDQDAPFIADRIEDAAHRTVAVLDARRPTAAALQPVGHLNIAPRLHRLLQGDLWRQKCLLSQT